MYFNFVFVFASTLSAAAVLHAAITRLIQNATILIHILFLFFFILYSLIYLSPLNMFVIYRKAAVSLILQQPFHFIFLFQDRMVLPDIHSNSASYNTLHLHGISMTSLVSSSDHCPYNSSLVYLDSILV